MQATGTTITSAGVVLAGTFAVFAVAAGTGASGNSQIRDVGTGLALGILMDTFLVRTLLVPGDRRAARPLELVAQPLVPASGRPAGGADAGARRRPVTGLSRRVGCLRGQGLVIGPVRSVTEELSALAGTRTCT